MEDEINFIPDERPTKQTNSVACFEEPLDDWSDNWPYPPDVMMELDEATLWNF